MIYFSKNSKFNTANNIEIATATNLIATTTYKSNNINTKKLYNTILYSKGANMINQKFVRKNGHSLIISIPKNKCETMGIRENTLLKVDQVGNTLVLTPLSGLAENSIANTNDGASA